MIELDRETMFPVLLYVLEVKINFEFEKGVGIATRKHMASEMSALNINNV